MNKLEELQAIIHNFADERNWIKYNNGKDLAISIALESSELLECFQWKTNEEAYQVEMEHIKEELADILIYCMRFADEHGFDVETLILDKLKKNAIKYPVK